MSLTHKILTLLATALLSLAAALSTPLQAEEHDYILATATPGGTYYPVGVALATLVRATVDPAKGISLRAVTTAGSADNVRRLRDGKAQFAILQGLFGRWAWTGEGKLEKDGPQRRLRSISMLWQNVEHFGLRRELVREGTVADLAALERVPFSIGQKGSGAEGSGCAILRGQGIALDEAFDQRHMGYGETAAALAKGEVDGFNIPAGPPVTALAQALNEVGDRYRILDFTDEQIERANGEWPLWSRYVIPAGTYPGQDAPIRTMAQPNFLAVHAEVDDTVVYAITRALYEHLDFLQGAHPATEAMSLEKAVLGLPVPLHPGAVRYYKERGVVLPARLIAP